MAPEASSPFAGLKVALVHDYLDQFGGQERVLLNMMELFPEAPIYTLLYEPKTMAKHINGRPIHTSILDTPLIRRRHRMFIPVLGHAAQSLKLEDKYDLIITNTMGFVKGVSYKSGVHIAYNHAPLRYAWEPFTYLQDMFPRFMIYAGMPAIQYVRWQDKQFSQRPDHMLANSHYIAGKLKNFYGREATVIHPPIEDHIFNFDPSVEKENYFLAYGRMIHYKKFPLVVEAFKRLGLPLKIVGSGPDEKAVRRAAEDAPNIEILPFMDIKPLRDIVRRAQATIVPQLEDFGLTTVESIACGTPVIGYNQGGTAEIVQDGLNGLLFEEQSVEGLVEAIKRFNQAMLEPSEVAQTAQRFSKNAFQEKFTKSILEALDSTVV